MAGWFKRLGSRLQALESPQVISIFAFSISCQFLAYYRLSSQVKSQLRHPSLSLDQSELVNHIIKTRFDYNLSQGMSLVQQLISAGLIGNCLNTARPVLLPILFCMGSTLSGVYATWAPAVQLLSLSSMIKDGNNVVMKHLESFYVHRYNNQPGYWKHLNTASLVLQTAGIYFSLPLLTAIPVCTFYLLINFL